MVTKFHISLTVVGVLLLGALISFLSIDAKNVHAALDNSQAVETIGTIHLGMLMGTGGQSSVDVTLEASADGTFYQLNATESQLASVQPETEVTVTGVLEDGVIIVDAIESTSQESSNGADASSVQSVESAALAAPEDVRVLIIPANWNDKTLLDDSDTCTSGGILATAETVSGWVDEASNGLQHLTFDVADTVTIQNYSWTFDYYGTYDGWGTDPVNTWANTLDSGASSQGYNLADYDARLYVFPTLTHGTTGWTPMNSGSTNGRMWNWRCDSEFNINSANGARNGFGVGYDSNSVYGNDYSSAMHGVVLTSNFHTPYDYAGYDKMRMNWISYTDVVEIPTGVTSYTLDPSDISPGANIQTLALPAYHPVHETFKNFISYRVPEGISAGLPSRFANKVIIHQGNDATYYTKTVVATLDVGDFWYDADVGYTVIFAALTGGGEAEVEVVDCSAERPLVSYKLPHINPYDAGETFEMDVIVINNNPVAKGKDGKDSCGNADFDVTITEPNGVDYVDFDSAQWLNIKPNSLKTGLATVALSTSADGPIVIKVTATDKNSSLKWTTNILIEAESMLIDETPPETPPSELEAQTPKNFKKCTKNSDCKITVLWQGDAQDSNGNIQFHTVYDNFVEIGSADFLNSVEFIFDPTISHSFTVTGTSGGGESAHSESLDIGPLVP